MNRRDFKKYLAEFIGTFALVLCGTGSIIVNQHSEGALGLLGIALAFGFIITSMIYIFGPISGSHINPAVTIALLVGKLMSLKDSVYYIIFQIFGAIAASSLLVYLFPDNLTLGATLPSGSASQSFIIEVVCTFFLMLTILGITSQKSKESVALAGIVIGFIVMGLIMLSGPISGGSFNPARSIGPALLSGNVSSLWIYLIAPTFGAILATFTWQFISSETVD
ncbi:MAG: MIP/aquaporin family protein [Saprospiraceae bacterium]